MVQVHPMAEMPVDEGVSVPRFSCRARRGIVTTGLISALTAVLFISSPNLVTTTPSHAVPSISLSNIIALIALALLLFFSIIMALVSLRRHTAPGKATSPLRGIIEGVAVLFGFLVLFSWIPYLVVSPTGVPPWTKALIELWVIFLAPFLIGIFSVRKLVRVKYGLISAVFAMLLISVVYSPLMYAASPPLMIPRLGVEIIPYLSGPSAGWASQVMLSCLLFGLVIGYGGRVLVGNHLSPMVLKRLLYLVAVLFLLLIVLGFVLIPRGGVSQEILFSRIPVYNGSWGDLESWVEPEDWIWGDNLTIFLKVGQVPTDLELQFSFETFLSEIERGGSGRGHWEEVKSDLVSRTVEFPVPKFPVSVQLGTPIPLDVNPSVFLCYIATENLTSGARLSRFWKTILPPGSQDPEKLIQPCLYKSRLAFKIDPSFRPEKGRLFYFDLAGKGSGVWGLTKASVLDRIYIFSGIGPLPGSKVPPKELLIWDSENESLHTMASEQHIIFLAVAFEGQRVAVSDVYVTKS